MESINNNISCPNQEDAPSSSYTSSIPRDILLITSTILLTCIAVCIYNSRIQTATTKRDGAVAKRIALRTQRKANATILQTTCTSLLRKGDAVSGEVFSSIIKQLWHHVNIAVSNCIKDTMEPMLKNLKIPLHFVKLDLGNVPIRTENIFIHAVGDDHNNDSISSSNDVDDDNDSTIPDQLGEHPGIQIDLDVIWDGNCDVMLQASLMGNANTNNSLAKSLAKSMVSPKVTLGVKRVKLRGRMHILLSPLTTELPVVSAIQYGFANPPEIQLEFAGVAESLAKQFAFVQPSVLGIVQSSLASLLVLPQRMIMPIDLISYDYLDTYQPPVGMIRISAVEGWGFSILKKRLINDIPDIYCLISLGGSSPPFRTSTVWDNCNPSWEDDSCDFILYDMDQKIYIKAYDDDPSPMDAGRELGNAEITVRDLCGKRRSLGEEDGGVLTAELELAWNGNPHTGCYIKISAEKFKLSNQLRSLSSPKYEREHHICGLVTIIVTRAFDIPLAEEEAASYVTVQYGNRSSNKFVTSTVPYDLNPRYMNGAFHVPLTADMMVQEDCLGDAAATAAFSMGGPAPRRNHGSLASSIAPKILVGRERTRKSTDRRENTRTKNNLATSMLKTSMSIVESAMHRKDQTPKNQNDIVFKLRNGDSSNTSSHKKLGSFTVTHESLVRARNHTITERRPIGEDGASLEFRVILSGMPTEDGDALLPRELEMLDLGLPVHDTTKRSIRVTALKGRGFLIKKKNLVLGHKNDIPDVYCYIRLNSSQQRQQQHQQSHGSLCWRTSTIKDDTMPKWNEEKTFTTANSNFDVVRVDVYAERRTSSDKYIGSAEYALEKLLRKRIMEMELRNGSKYTGSFVSLKGVQTELVTDDAITDESEHDEMDDASYDFGEGDVLASGLGPPSTSPHQNECDSINSNILAAGLGLSPGTSNLDECDTIGSDSEDDDGDDFTQSLPAGPTWVQPHSDENVHNRKAISRAISLPANVKDNLKEKLTSQLAKKRHTIDHARKEARDIKANLASHLPGHSL